jgi:hypothetical protein
MEVKQCNKCNEVKVLDQFAWQYKKKGRRQPKCKCCMNGYAAAVREVNRAVRTVQEVPKVLREKKIPAKPQANIKKVQEAKKSKRGTYGGYCVVVYKAKYLLILQEAVKKAKQKYLANWRANNKGYQHAYHEQRKQEDPIFALKLATRSMISQTFKRACKGHFSKQEHTLDLLGCSFEFFASHIISQFTEGMTLENYGEWHLDHIIPLATAITREDVVRLNHYTNFQPLWAKDNLSKGSKIL